MPASEVMSLYRQHKLHSGPGGPVVKSKKQATAIQISMARKEGHHIPKVKGSFQKGGLVQGTGQYHVHEGEEIVPPSDEELRAGSAQAQDIAARTRGAQESAYQAAMHRPPHVPWDLRGGAPGKNDPSYAIQGLQSSVAERQRQMGIKGSFQEGGTVQETGNYKAHAGEELVPDRYAGARHQNFSFPIRDTEMGGAPDIGIVPDRYSGATQQNFSFPIRDTGVSAAPDIRTPTPGMPPALGNVPPPEKPEQQHKRDNPELRQMQAAVAAPLQRVEGFKRGGTIPRTGIYRLHAGEHVIPKSLAGRYREMKAHG